MLKNGLKKRLLLLLSCLLIIFIIYIFPAKDKQVVLTENKNTSFETIIYLKNKNNYISRVSVYIKETRQDKVIKEIINYLTVGSANSFYIKEGFFPIIPRNTMLIGLSVLDENVILNFSKELLNIDAKDEENMISAIVYSLTSLDGIKSVSIQIDGKSLEKLPNSKKELPSLLDRSFGINKVYDLTKTSGTNQTTVYYLSRENDYYYYVPVTLIGNDSKDKLEIIIKELSSKNSYQTGMISYIRGIQKISYILADDSLSINMNKSLFSELDEKNLLETVIYSMNLSIKDNFNVVKVNYTVDDYLYKSYYL